MRELDQMWILVRRAAGYDQRSGVVGRIFAITAAICASGFMVWFVFIHGPGPNFISGNGGMSRVCSRAWRLRRVHCQRDS